MPARSSKEEQPDGSRGRSRAAIAAIALLPLAALASIYGTPVGFQAQYVLVVALIVFWMMVVGKAFNDRFDGLLIDGRNRISLSRLQLFVWLVITGCAFAVEVAHNFWTQEPNPDSLIVPGELGFVLGAATTSFVASPAILSLKTRSGRLFSRHRPNGAVWSDLFRGEEKGTSGDPDPTKIQQFLVTFLLAAIYLTALWRDLGRTPAETFNTLPGLSEGGLVLLGVSHAAYLGGKAVPQTPAGMPTVDTAPMPPAASTKPAP